MKFEIDVCGSDIFNDDYVICITDGDGIIQGFKFSKELTAEIVGKWVRGKYKYKHSASKQGIFKVRLYCIILYHLFKAIPNCKEVDLYICRDFYGRENEIKQNLHYFLEEKCQIKINNLVYGKLPPDSDAHWYAYLMHKDKYNKLPTYVNIKIEEIEPFLHEFNMVPKGLKTEP
ncbi:MAG: hypothetical protein AABX26_03265 [Nanoarchaeota archaeon]